MPAVIHGIGEGDGDEVCFVARLAVEVAQALAGGEGPGIGRRHEAFEVVAAALDGFGTPEAVGHDADDALHALDLLSGHWKVAESILCGRERRRSAAVAIPIGSSQKARVCHDPS